MDMTIWLNAFLALFAILNPIGTIPIFSEITEGLDKKGRFAVFNVAAVTAFGTLLLDRDGYLVTVTAIVAVFIVSWVLIQLTPWISRLMGKIGRMVVSRILWIFMAALGVHFLLTGIQEMFGL